MQHLRSLSPSELLLRLGLAFAFIYPAVDAIFDPYAWSGYFPTFVLRLAGSGELLLLHLFGALEVALALWILFGKNIRVPSSIAAIVLLAIVAVNPSQFPILFRDVSIAFMAIALALMSKNSEHG